MGVSPYLQKVFEGVLVGEEGEVRLEGRKVVHLHICLCVCVRERVCVEDCCLCVCNRKLPERVDRLYTGGGAAPRLLRGLHQGLIRRGVLRASCTKGCTS